MIFDLPQEIILVISQILDVKSLMLLYKTNKFGYDLYSKQALNLLRTVIKNLTKLDINKYELEKLYNIYRLRDAQLSISNTHPLILDLKKQVHTCDLTHNRIPKLEVIPDLNNIIKILAGKDFSFMLDHNGDVYILSCDDDGNVDVDNKPKLVPDLDKIKHISGSPCDVFFISENNKIYESSSVLYQDGIKWTNSKNIKFKVIASIDNAIDATSCEKYNYILSSDHNIHCLEGYNHNYEHFYTDESIIHISVDFIYLAVLRSDGKVGWSKTPFTGNFELIEKLNNIIDISITDYYSIALDNTGHVYIWAIVEEKMIGPVLISSLSNIIKISSYTDYMLMMDYNGNIYFYHAYDFDEYSEFQAYINRIKPILIPNFNLLNYKL